MRIRLYISVAYALAVVLLSTACGPRRADQNPSDGFARQFNDPSRPLPETLASFGLFPTPDDLESASAEALEYEPAYPLWSNGSFKLRHIVLPAGSVIDTSGQSWQFPVGTLLFKTFTFGAADARRPVETRVLRKLEERWEYAAYLWDDSGQDGVRLDLVRPVDVPVTLSDGTSLVHQVPNKLQCRSCHEAGAGQVLGINARQLTNNPQAPVATWQREGHLSELPDAPEPLSGDPSTQWIKGYAVGNCVHCHNGGDAPNSSYSLYPADFIEHTVNHPTEGNASVAGTRVVPGDAEASVLYRAVRGGDDETELKAMPPEGVQLRDREAIARIRTWIENIDSD